MFGNLVNAQDLGRVVEKVRQGYGARLLRTFRPAAADRVRAAWEETERQPRDWWSVPAVRARWNRLITGDAELDPIAYVASTHLPPEGGLVGLSLGCGTGRKEVRWVQTGRFSRFEAYDISEPLIRDARRHAEAEGCADVLAFDVADAHAFDLAPAAFDFVLLDSALHHFAPVAPVLDRIAATMKPGGLLVLRDFVGPSRFQWTDRQMEAVEGLLALLPERYRTRWGSGSVKRRAYKPGRLTLRLSDPSEAAESARILSELRRRFVEVECSGFGGTILHPLLHDIAHHFHAGDDDDAARYLDVCFRAEDALLASGDLPSDFVFAVFENPAR